MALDATSEIISAILKEEQNEKLQRKKRKGHEEVVARKDKKGKTLDQMESEEGGPVQESRVPMAQTQRAAKRKGGKDADTTILGVGELQYAEEELAVPEEGGVKLEAFNLKEERARGHFDEAGSYVEDVKGSDDEDADDAWLKSEEATVVSEEVQQRIRAAEAAGQAAAVAAAEPLTATQIARLQHEAAGLLTQGETLAAGLRRLGAGLARRVGKQASRQEKQAPPDPERAARFGRLTELGVALMEAGESDVYTQTKEYFARAAAVYIDDDEGPSTLFGATAPVTTAYDDADEDMFGSDAEASPKADGQEKEGAEPGSIAPAAVGTTAAPQPEAGEEPAASTREHYANWPIKELRRFLTERGIDPSNIVEKGDLVARVAAAAAAAEAAASVPVPPPGYTHDPASGYWYSADAGLHWDPSSGGFYSSEAGKWYAWDDASQQFVEWKK